MHHRLLTLATAGALTLGLTACGGDDEATTTTTTTTTRTTDAATVTTADAAAAPTTTDAAASSDAATSSDAAVLTDTATSTDDAAGSTDGGTAAGAGTEAGVPELEEIWPAVLKNAKEAESAKVGFTGVLDGADADMTLQGRADDSNYSLEMQMDGAHVEVRSDGKTLYMKGDQKFWEVTGAPKADALADRWVIAPPGMDDSMSFSTLWDEMVGSLPEGSGDLQTSSAVKDELDGVPAYRYSIKSEDAEVWVSADGEDNLLKATIADPEGDIEITFSDWNDVKKIKMPKDAVPAEELMAG